MSDESCSPAERLADPATEAAKRLGLSDATVWRLIRAKELQSFKVGKRRMVSRQAQANFIRQREAAA